MNFSSFELKTIHAKYASSSKSLHSNFSNLFLLSSVSVQWRIQDFPEVGAPTFQGAPTYDFAKSSQKLHGIDRIWTGGGGASKILLYTSAIDVYWCHIHILVFHDMMNILYDELCSKIYYKFRYNLNLPCDLNGKYTKNLHYIISL